MKGRKPKPTNLKIIEGNPWKRKINHAEPVSKKNARTTPPSHFNDPYAIEAYKSIIVELNELGVTKKTDEMALEILCTLYARFRRMQQNALTTKGNLKANAPDLSKIAREIRSLLAEFGMTPSSRSRITIEAPQENENPWGEFFRDDCKTG